MSLQPITIAPYDKGLQNDKKPFLLIDSAFQELTNAFVWRERVKKREGIKFIGRLRRVLTAVAGGSVTIAAGATTTFNLFTQLGITGEDDANIQLGNATDNITLSFAAPLSQTWTDATGTGIMTGFAGSITSVSINYSTGDVIVVDGGAGFAISVMTVTLNYFPALPVMGIITRELAAINVEECIFFDTKYAYTFNNVLLNFSELASTAATTWQGSNSNFFWGSNYQGAVSSTRLFFVTNFNNVTPTNDPIRFYNGVTWAALTPLVTATRTMFQARIIIPYYSRLLAFNLWEGTTVGGAAGASNFFNRCRFSQLGDPTSVDAWRSDQFGLGGVIDAPTNEAIISAKFYKDTLIVFFERTTWTLEYVGEYGFPFVWNRISSDLGSESTFSTVLFDDGILAVGDKAIIAATNNNIQRIDLQIPDNVYRFKNEDAAKNRVHGIRDFQKEVVYWTYPEGGIAGTFPNRVLVYNYRNNTWAIFRDNVTAFGQFTTATAIQWDDPVSWDLPIEWDTLFQVQFPVIGCGNQQGYIHLYQYPPDIQSLPDSNVNMIENESLYISGETRSATAALRINVINHNLQALEIIFITGMIFVTTSTGTVLSTTLNNRFYEIKSVIDADNIELSFWNFASIEVDKYERASGDNLNFTPATGTGTYMGGGEVTLIPKLSIRTKDFNPFQEQGKQMMLSYIDFQTDATPNASVSVELLINSNSSKAANVIVGSTDTETSLRNFGIITGATQANPCQITSVNHGLRTDNEITIRNVLGMVELNDIDYVVTFVDLDNFTLNTIDSSAFTAYTSAGNWSQLTVQFYYITGSRYAWHRFYATAHGQYVTVHITYDDALMNVINTHQEKFEMNAMQLWVRPAGRTI